MKTFNHYKDLIIESARNKHWYINGTKNLMVASKSGYKIIMDLREEKDKYIRIFTPTNEIVMFLNTVEKMSVVFVLDTLTGIGVMERDKPFIDAYNEAIKVING